MYKKHSIEERLLAVQKCLNGHSPRSVGRQMGIHESYVAEWLDCYHQDGLLGLQKHSKKHADYAEKCKIVCEYAEKGVPLHRVSAKYHVSQTTICSWTRVYRKGGYEALRELKPSGRSKSMGRPKKQEPQTELERLRYEVKYLRAENALLKKVRALMEEKEKRLHETGRKPSKH